MGTGEFNAGGNPAMDWHPIQGGVEIFLVASCHGNRDKLRPGGPLGSYADLQTGNQEFCLSLKTCKTSRLRFLCRHFRKRTPMLISLGDPWTEKRFVSQLLRLDNGNFFVTLQTYTCGHSLNFQRVFFSNRDT